MSGPDNLRNRVSHIMRKRRVQQPLADEQLREEWPAHTREAGMGALVRLDQDELGRNAGHFAGDALPSAIVSDDLLEYGGRADVDPTAAASLVAPASGAPPSVSPQPVAMLGAFPVVCVSDVRAACDYFTDRLGFATTVLHGSPPFYAEVQRDGACIALRHGGGVLLDPALRRQRKREELPVAGIHVDDVQALFAEFQAAGATVFQPLREEPWGAWSFILEDPDGNLFTWCG